jgi:hypothetical protein
MYATDASFQGRVFGRTSDNFSFTLWVYIASVPEEDGAEVDILSLVPFGGLAFLKVSYVAGSQLIRATHEGKLLNLRYYDTVAFLDLDLTSKT